MQLLFPGFRYRKESRIWAGRLQPTDLSPDYRLNVVYRSSRSPLVYVTEPKISSAPHRYPDGSLCLFYPADRSWRDDSLIALTIVPWAAEWLYYYECWRDTGTWFGDEVSHSGVKQRS